MKVCKYCGNQMFDQAVMCTKCGCMCEKPKKNLRNILSLVSSIVFLVGQVAMALIFVFVPLWTEEFKIAHYNYDSNWVMESTSYRYEYRNVRTFDNLFTDLLFLVLLLTIVLIAAYGVFIAIRSLISGKNLWLSNLTCLVISGIQTLIIAYWAFFARFMDEETHVEGAKSFVIVFVISLIVLIMSAISFAFTKKEEK